MTRRCEAKVTRSWGWVGDRWDPCPGQRRDPRMTSAFFFDKMNSATPRLQRLSRDACGPASMAPWTAMESSLPKRHDAMNTGREMQRRTAAKVPCSSWPPHARGGPGGGGASLNLGAVRRNGRPARDAEDLPRQTEHAHDDRLLYEGGTPNSLGHALDGASSTKPARFPFGDRPQLSLELRPPRRL
jgi:hypothetical protein